MSVVIKMDMPKSCGMCECSGTSVCREWMKVDRRNMGSKRADTCPILCELPEKHGGLIDRDELKKHKEYNLERNENVVSVACIDWMMPLVEKEVNHENSI